MGLFNIFKHNNTVDNQQQNLQPQQQAPVNNKDF